MVVKNDEKHDYKSTKRPVSTAFRTLYSQMHCLITLHETFNDLMLYKDGVFIIYLWHISAGLQLPVVSSRFQSTQSMVLIAARCKFGSKTRHREV